MKFTKIIAMAAALAVCAAMLTACGEDTAGETVTSVETTTTASETESETESATESATESEASETESETEAESDVSEGESAEANPLMPFVDAVISHGEWPWLVEVTDAQMLKDFFLLDPENENYTQMIVMQNPMSSNITEIIIIEAADVDAAKADLEARQKKAQEQDAFYPNDVERAGASIVGTEGSYAYFLLTDVPADDEANLIAAINAE